MQKSKNGLKFILESIRNIRTTGTVFPSSQVLVRKMLSPVDFEKAKVIVELGGGNGVITRELLQNMRPDAILLTFEINPDFVKLLKQIKDPRLHVISDSAEYIEKYLNQFGHNKADYILSGLPLAIFNKELTSNILNAIKATLSSEGSYIQFQYSLNSLGDLKKQFRKVGFSFTPINLPPAFVYVCHL